MGNRAVITTKDKKIGVYVHWNGGYDSINAFVTYCRLKGYRKPEEDNYGFARLCQVIGNYFTANTAEERKYNIGGLSLGIGTFEDYDNWLLDNGFYIIEGWRIVGREGNHGIKVDFDEQHNHDLIEMLHAINKKMPRWERLPARVINAVKKDPDYKPGLRPGTY